MDISKIDFVVEAPLYYALAIASYFKRHGGAILSDPASQFVIKRDYTTGYEREEAYCYLEHEIIFNKAMEWLIEKGLINVTRGRFGPPILAADAFFEQQWEKVSKGGTEAFQIYDSQPNGQDDWLRGALQSVNRTFDTLGVTADDFDAPDREWEPLTLDRRLIPLTQVGLDVVY
jgi:hypothetical protein